jgi:CheY-like chemotaxis protein
MPDERSSVLVIEDLPHHRERIKSALLDAGYAVEAVAWMDERDISQYKALNPHNRVIVIDLILPNASGSTVTIAGWDLILRLLWPLDRTTHFVLFSINALALDQLRPSTEVGPMVVAVPKRELEGQLTVESLADLVARVHDCHDVAPPVLPRPRYEQFQYLRHLDIYEALVPASTSRRAYREMVAESVRVLTSLTDHASTIAYSGAAARDLTCFVFGSCGRYEMRADSDVEMSIYFQGASELEERQRQLLAMKMWNRVARGISAPDIGYPYEGADSLPNGFLDDAYSEVELNSKFDLQNGFRPILSIRDLLGADPTRVQNVRNRYLQVLTEGKPVFNSPLFQDVSRRIVDSLAPNIKLGRELHNERVRDVMEQFERDTTPRRFDGSKDAKALVYRYLNLLAFRLGLVFLDDHFWSWRRNVDTDLAELLEFIGSPGVIKCVRFTNHCSREKIGTLVKPMQLLVEAYFGTLEMFQTKYGGGIRSGKEPTTTDHSAMRDELKDLLGKFVSVFLTIRDSGLIPRKSSAWLCETEGMIRRAEAL